MPDNTRDYLDDLCDYKGPGSDLPLGGYSAIPNWGPEHLAKTWVIEDAESDAGIKEVRTHELNPGDIIFGVKLNANTLKYIIKSSPYAENFFKIREANGGPLMNLDQWYAKFGTNGLGLVAIRNMRQILDGSRQEPIVIGGKRIK